MSRWAANNLEPSGADIDRLAESNRNVSVRCLIDRAVGWCGAGYSRSHVDGGKTEDKVRRHVVGRICAVLIAHLCGRDRNSARLIRREVSVRINRKGVGPP